MLDRWVLIPGLIFDTRSILLVVTGLYFGPIPTLIAVAFTATFRILNGGVGMITGVGVIVTSAGMGLFWRYYFPNRKRWKDLYLLGLSTHVFMLGWMLIMPSSISSNDRLIFLIRTLSRSRMRNR